MHTSTSIFNIYILLRQQEIHSYKGIRKVSERRDSTETYKSCHEEERAKENHKRKSLTHEMIPPTLLCTQSIYPQQATYTKHESIKTNVVCLEKSSLLRPMRRGYTYFLFLFLLLHLRLSFSRSRVLIRKRVLHMKVLRLVLVPRRRCTCTCTCWTGCSRGEEWRSGD